MSLVDWLVTSFSQRQNNWKPFLFLKRPGRPALSSSCVELCKDVTQNDDDDDGLDPWADSNDGTHIAIWIDDGGHLLLSIKSRGTTTDKQTHVFILIIIISDDFSFSALHALWHWVFFSCSKSFLYWRLFGHCFHWGPPLHCVLNDWFREQNRITWKLLLVFRYLAYFF